MNCEKENISNFNACRFDKNSQGLPPVLNFNPDIPLFCQSEEMQVTSLNNYGLSVPIFKTDQEWTNFYEEKKKESKKFARKYFKDPTKTKSNNNKVMKENRPPLTISSG